MLRLVPALHFAPAAMFLRRCDGSSRGLTYMFDRRGSLLSSLVNIPNGCVVMLLRFSMVLLVFGILVGCDRPVQSNPPGNIVQGGGFSQSGGLTISSPNFVAVEGLPIVGFSVVKLDDTESSFGYFLIVRPPGNGNPQSRGFGGSSSSNGQSGKSVGQFRLDGNEVQVSLEIDKQTEKLAIDETNYDVSKGRLFLVDMQSDPATIKQIDTELPAPDSTVTSTEQAEEIAQKTIEQLKESSGVVAEFLGK